MLLGSFLVYQWQGECSVSRLAYRCCYMRDPRTVRLLYELPEVASLALKLSSRMPLSEGDERVLLELAQASGWGIDDVREELGNLWVDPSEKVDKYGELFERYYREALETVNKDPRQAAEKLWGSITALVKLHAALKRVFIAEWDHGRLFNYVTHNVEKAQQKLFFDLLKTGRELHIYFYGRHLDPETFKVFWSEAVELLGQAREVVYKLLQSH